MSGTTRTERRKPPPRRRGLPKGWRVLRGGRGTPARETDPTTEQTREFTHVLFAAAMTSGIGFVREPQLAHLQWSDHALRRKDQGLCSILDRLDPETFANTWRELVRRAESHGYEATIEWLQRRRGDSP